MTRLRRSYACVTYWSLSVGSPRLWYTPRIDVREREVRIEIDRVLELRNGFALLPRRAQRTRERIGFQRVERRGRDILERHVEPLD